MSKNDVEALIAAPFIYSLFEPPLSFVIPSLKIHKIKIIILIINLYIILRG
jgi:hypothetical protein